VLSFIKKYINNIAILNNKNPLYICKGYLRHGKNKKTNNEENLYFTINWGIKSRGK